MPQAMPATPTWESLQFDSTGADIGVDRDAKVIRGYVVAQLGPFKSKGRGEFDLPALEKIVELGNAKGSGLKSRFTHPDLSSDGLGTYLGRAKNFRLDEDRVRADLHLGDASFDSPTHGDIGGYIMDLAEEDPAAFSSSLVLERDVEYRLNDDGTPQRDEDGERLPPLWRPTRLHATDVVDTGDAVDDFLSLPDGHARTVSGVLDRLFTGQSRDVVEQRCGDFIDRYLNRKFGEPAMSQTDTKPAADTPAETDEQLSAEVKQLREENARLSDDLKAARKPAEGEQNAIAKQVTGVKGIAQDATQLATDRAAEIVSLCELADMPEKATDYIRSELSAAEVGVALLKEQSKKREPVGHNDDEADELASKQDPDAKAKKEYRDQREVFESMGVSEDEYVESCRIEARGGVISMIPGRN